jgi:hypothetical protein
MFWTHEGRNNQPKAQGSAKLAGLELAKRRPTAVPTALNCSAV